MATAETLLATAKAFRARLGDWYQARVATETPLPRFLDPQDYPKTGAARDSEEFWQDYLSEFSTDAAQLHDDFLALGIRPREERQRYAFGNNRLVVEDLLTDIDEMIVRLEKRPH